MKRELLAVSVVVFLFCFFVSAAAQNEPISQFWLVKITCPGDSVGRDTTVRISPDSVNINKRDGVKFSMDTLTSDGCDSVTVNGTSPIGIFKLTHTHRDTMITFAIDTTGKFRYTVKTFPTQADSAKGLVQVSALTPTLTGWGIIILVALIAASTVFIVLRRRKAAVPA
jgi:hypothetical protein